MSLRCAPSFDMQVSYAPGQNAQKVTENAYFNETKQNVPIFSEKQLFQSPNNGAITKGDRNDF